MNATLHSWTARAAVLLVALSCSTAGAKEAAPPPTNGFTPGKGFRLVSDDGNWSLRVGLQAGYRLQTLITPSTEGEARQPTGSFFVVRPRVDGTLFKEWIRFWTSFEFASNPPFLLDSFVEAQPVPYFGVRLGQFWSVTSWHEQLGPQELVFPDWAFVAEYFWLGRDKGIQFFGNLPEGTFRYELSLTGGSPLRQFQTIPGNFVVQGAVRFYPLGKLEDTTEFPYMMIADRVPTRLGISVSGWAAKLQETESNFNPTRGQFKAVPTGVRHREQGGEADVLFQTGPVNLYAEGWLKRTDPVPTDARSAFLATGVWAQGSFVVIPKVLDVALQAGWLEPNFDVDSDNFIYGQAQVGFYVYKNNVNMRARYLIGHQDSPGTPAVEATLPATPGWNHVITLQWNVYF
ncbi:MAG: hypothetical protein IRZ16_02250 [Myxococcaceae bacterium]|nr:hypothetical protein [Myxococcaceae bacterium]